MYKVIITLLAIAASAAAQSAPPIEVPIWKGSQIVFATLDPSGFQLVQTGGLFVLKALASAPQKLNPPADSVFPISGARPTFSAVCTPFDAYRNGVRQTAGYDFDVDATGLQITYRPDSTPEAGDLVVIAYRCGVQ